MKTLIGLVGFAVRAAALGAFGAVLLPTTISAAPAAPATMAPMPGMTMAPMPGMTMAPAKPAARATATPSAKPATPATATPTVSPAEVPAAVPSPAPAGSMDGMKMDGPPAGGMSTDAMHSTTDIADPMSQDGSGTAWVPKSTQMFGWMRMGARDMQMTHGAIFPRYVSAGSQRGSRRADAPNWLMFMGTHALGERAQFGYTAMLSADTLTENQTGYPLLFQTGESAYGMQLHDRQHPHDLFSELAVTYSTRLGAASSAYVYLGYPGEPALGPTAFMHRRIAYDMPDSTIGHHWQDASHIQFGVATLGFAPAANVKIEASTFTGREPNEVRTNFDRIHLDSYSTRLSWNPNDNVSTEVSYAFIKSPEALDPLTNQHRLVGSLLYNKPLGVDRNLYAGFVVGQNIESGGGRTSSYLAEADYQMGANTAYARLEAGTRTARDLVIPNVDPATVYSVGAYTFGGVHDLTRNPAALNVGLGAQFTLGSKAAGLDALYGSGTPLGYEVFLRIRPPDLAHTMNAMAGMTGGTKR